MKNMRIDPNKRCVTPRDRFFAEWHEQVDVTLNYQYE